MISAALESGGGNEQRQRCAGLMIGFAFRIAGCTTEESGHDRIITADFVTQLIEGNSRSFDSFFCDRGRKIPAPEQRALPMCGFFRITVRCGISEWCLTESKEIIDQLRRGIRLCVAGAERGDDEMKRALELGAADLRCHELRRGEKSAQGRANVTARIEKRTARSRLRRACHR